MRMFLNFFFRRITSHPISLNTSLRSPVTRVKPWDEEDAIKDSTSVVLPSPHSSSDTIDVALADVATPLPVHFPPRIPKTSRPFSAHTIWRILSLSNLTFTPFILFTKIRLLHSFHSTISFHFILSFTMYRWFHRCVLVTCNLAPKLEVFYDALPWLLSSMYIRNN